MGRPRKGDSPKRKAKESGEFREAIVYMKGSPEYFDFVEKVATKTGISKVQIFRLSFAEWCERGGHGTPPQI